jgi:hypothetical protein
MAKTEASLCYGVDGWYVEWFKEDSACPMGFRGAAWYGTREECVARMREPAPRLFPARESRAA